MAADLVIVPSEVFARTAADYIARAIGAALRPGEPISVALSGGRGPRPVYLELVGTDTVPWEGVELFFADERAVPAGDPRSNYRLVTETLGSRFAGRPGAIHRMEADRPDLEQAAQDYENRIPHRFDLLVLGMGEDGHTASLFPGHPAIREEHRRVLAIRGPAMPPWRMTITPPVIRDAAVTLMLVAGEAKAAAVRETWQGPLDPVRCPAQLAREATWILDQPAASLLGSNAS